MPSRQGTSTVNFGRDVEAVRRLRGTLKRSRGVVRSHSGLAALRPVRSRAMSVRTGRELDPPTSTPHPNVDEVEIAEVPIGAMHEPALVDAAIAEAVEPDQAETTE